MRLTAELITSSLTYLNPLKERELDLRGHRIPAIENFGVTKDQFEALDLTDNDIAVLGNFPLSPRLQTLLLARNRVHSVQLGLGKSLPNLSTLMLGGNEVKELADLEGLGGCARLVHLVLSENPVASKENYRYYTIHLIPTVRFLDYRKVKAAERAHATELFGTPTAPTDLALQISQQKSRNFSGGMNGATKKTQVKFDEREKARFERLVKKAASFKEIQELEKMFAEGRLPPGGGNEGEAMDET